MSRFLVGLGWWAVAVLVFLFWLTLVTAGTAVALVLLLILVALVVAELMYAAWQRRAASLLPPGLRRLAYKPDATSVTFAWQVAAATRVRILRSEHGPAASADDTLARWSGGDETRVYDGTGGGGFVDSGLHPQTCYHFSLFVQRKGHAWEEPVLQPVIAMSAADRAFYDAAESAAAERDAACLPFLARAAQDNRLYEIMPPSRLYGIIQPAAGMASMLSSLLIDVLFAIIDALKHPKPDDGWIHVT